MKYCKNCKINVDTNHDYCPLCFRELSGSGQETSAPMFAERKANERTIKKSTLVSKLFIYISLCVVAICLVVNFLTDSSVLWSLVVISGIVYVWILVAHTIISKRGIFEKVLMQVLGVIFVLIVSENISPTKNWLQCYVYPSVSLLTVCSLLMIIFIKKDKSWILSFVIITLLTGLTSVFLLGIDSFKLMNIINIIFCALTVLGYFTFGYNLIKQEFIKKFHL